MHYKFVSFQPYREEDPIGCGRLRSSFQEKAQDSGSNTSATISIDQDHDPEMENTIDRTWVHKREDEGNVEEYFREIEDVFRSYEQEFQQQCDTIEYARHKTSTEKERQGLSHPERTEDDDTDGDDDDDDDEGEEEEVGEEEPEGRTDAFRQKLWYYLFRNINSVVDELYCMCELESSIEKCEIASRVLDSCREDFLKLAERLRLQHQAPLNPKAMAWEIRKSSNSEKPTVAKALKRLAHSSSGDLDTSEASNFCNNTTSFEGESQDRDLSRLSGSKSNPEEAVSPNERSRSKLRIDTSHEHTPSVSSPNHSHDSLSPISGGRRTLHDKLSSPERRKRTPSETKRLQEQRQFAAQVNRGKIDSARQTRLRLAAERLKGVNERKAQRLARQEEMMWAKLGRADALHEAHVRWVMRKAVSENTKVDEVGFIKSLTTEHRKASLQQRLDDVAERREQHLHQIRTRASENVENVRAATIRRHQKMASVLAQKHAAMQKRHEDVQTRRQERQKEMQQRFSNKASERRKVAKQLSTLREQCQVGATAEDEAPDMDYSTPVWPMHSEVVNAEKTISDRKDCQGRARIMRQKAKKLRRKLASKSPGYEEPIASVDIRATDDVYRRYERLLIQLDVDYEINGGNGKSLSSHLEQVDTALEDMLKFQEERTECDLHTFRRLGGIHRVAKWASRATAAVSTRVVKKALRVLYISCELNTNKDYLLATNCMPELVDLLVWALNCIDDTDLVGAALDAVKLPLRHTTTEELEVVRSSVIRYIVNAGAMVSIADRFERYHHSSMAGLSTPHCRLLYKCVDFLEALTAIAGLRLHPVLTMADLRLPVVTVFQDTGLMGIISLLISLIMESRPQRRSESFVLSPRILSISCMALKVLNNVARLDISIVQDTLSSKSLQQTFIHVLGFFLASVLSEHSVNEEEDVLDVLPNEALLKELLILIGYYTLQNPQNQETLRWGNSPNIIQRLSALPFRYFSEMHYKDILFPTLISICYGDCKNCHVMQNDVSLEMLVNYIHKRWESQCTSLNDEHPGEGYTSWMRFAHRFPVFLWKDALHFFSSTELSDDDQMSIN